MGISIEFNILSIICLGVLSLICALRLRLILCVRICGAITLTSSGITKVLESTAAFAWQALYKSKLALGLAPKIMSSSLRVAVTILIM